MIPVSALDDRHAFVGTAGSGKTYSSGAAVELILDKHGRVIIIDPLGVWYGLRLLPDGKSPSPYNVVIFGGQHADLPITENAGAVIGETVATMAESCIVDLSGLGTKAAERRFMLAFLTALYRKTNGEPVHIVFDEADMFAPQRLLDKDGEAAKLLGQMETIVRRGRVRGFIPWLITQRPAVLSKDVLSQADGLIAFKLTSSQDRDAIGAWIEGQADKAQGKEILASLPALQQGQGVVWIPGRGILETAKFPLKKTFDSSRTPKRGEKRQTTTLRPLDVPKLKEKLSTIEAETKANDPRALKAELAQLKRQMADAVSQKIVVDPKALEAAEQRGFERGYREGHILYGQLAAAMDKVKAAFIAANKQLVDALEAAKMDMRSKSISAHNSGLSPSQTSASRPDAQKEQTPLRKPSPATGGDGDLSPPQFRTVRSLSFWQGIGEGAPTREQVAAVAGYKPGSGNFNNLLGGLKSAGLIEYPAPGLVSLLGIPADSMSRAEARDMMLGVLTGPQRKIIEAAAQRSSHTRESLAAATDYAAGSGNFNNLLGSLRTIGILVYPSQGHVALSDWARELLG